MKATLDGEEVTPTTASKTGYSLAENQEVIVLSGTVTTLTNAPTDSSGITALLDRITSARAGYIDNLNVAGPVATQADVDALNQSAARRIKVVTVGQYERPEADSTDYEIELRTYDGDGEAVDADETPTITATGSVSGDLSSNLGEIANPATGVYRLNYSVAHDAVLQPTLRIDCSAVVSGSVFTISAYPQIVDLVGVTWTSNDRSMLTNVYNKLPTRNFLTGSADSTGETQTDSTAALNAYDPPTANEIDAALTALESHGDEAWTTETSDPDNLLDWPDAVETGVTIRQALRIMGAVLAGKVSGGGTGTEIFVGLDSLSTRVSVTVDAAGNRSAVTYG